MEKIRIAHLIGSLQYGGAENQAVQLVNGLDASRFERYLVVFREVENRNSKGLDSDVVLSRVPLRRWGQIACIRSLVRLFKGRRFHIVQSHMFHTNLYVALAAGIAGVPVVITTEHGRNLWKNFFHHLMERRIISPLASMRVAVSRDIQEIRIGTGDIPRAKTVVITPCVAIPEPAVDYRKHDPVRIGTVGRMVEAKDYPSLLLAFKKVIDRNIQAVLTFVGDGPGRRNLEDMVKRHGLSEYVRFAGFRENVGDWLKKFDIFVLSSIREGIPVAMLEAMAVGLPVVATRAGGIPEVIRDGRDGLLVDCANPDFLAGAVARLAGDMSLRKKIGLSGRKRVAGMFSREAVCRQYEDLYLRLLKQAGIHVQ